MTMSVRHYCSKTIIFFKLSYWYQSCNWTMILVMLAGESSEVPGRLLHTSFRPSTTTLSQSTPPYWATVLLAEDVRAPSGLFSHRSYFVELFTRSSPWPDTEFWQLQETRLKTEFCELLNKLSALEMHQDSALCNYIQPYCAESAIKSQRSDLDLVGSDTTELVLVLVVLALSACVLRVQLHWMLSSIKTMIRLKRAKLRAEMSQSQSKKDNWHLLNWSASLHSALQGGQNTRN